MNILLILLVNLIIYFSALSVPESSIGQITKQNETALKGNELCIQRSICTILYINVLEKNIFLFHVK